MQQKIRTIGELAYYGKAALNLLVVMDKQTASKYGVMHLLSSELPMDKPVEPSITFLNWEEPLYRVADLDGKLPATVVWYDRTVVMRTEGDIVVGVSSARLGDVYQMAPLHDWGNYRVAVNNPVMSAVELFEFIDNHVDSNGSLVIEINSDAAQILGVSDLLESEAPPKFKEGVAFLHREDDEPRPELSEGEQRIRVYMTDNTPYALAEWSDRRPVQKPLRSISRGEYSARNLIPNPVPSAAIAGLHHLTNRYGSCLIYGTLDVLTEVGLVPYVKMSDIDTYEKEHRIQELIGVHLANCVTLKTKAVFALEYDVDDYKVIDRLKEKFEVALELTKQNDEVYVSVYGLSPLPIK
ncbi:MAG: hypothetical protein ACRDBQ_18980 [Shewanella sp.]